MRRLRGLKKRFVLWVLRCLMDEKGGLSLGGPGSNSLTDIYNTINNNGSPPGLPLNSVQHHSPLNGFAGNANFRFIAASGVLVGKDIKVVLNSNAGPGDNYIIGNGTNDYIELYTDGALRAQF